LLKGQLRSPKHGRRQQAQLSVAKPGLQLRPAQRRLDRLEHRFSAAVSALRTRVRRGLDLAAPPAQHALFAALAMGDRTGLDDRDREAFVRTGTAHLLAISGLHVGLVALTLVALLRRPLGLLLIWVARPMAAAGWSSHLALAVSVSGAALYVLVAGSPVSARRALLMIVCAAAASLLERPRAGAHGLALAALGIAWLDPLSIFDTALHLSVVSVAGLLLLSGCMGPSRTGRLRWLQASLSLVAASAAAAAATAPICLWAFGRVPLAGLWVNPLVVPLLGSLTLPPLLAGAGLSAVSPRLGAPLLQVAAWPAALGSRVVRWAALPERSPELVAELAAADVCALYCVCAALATLLYVARRSR
jgi:competence protein ComEC